jgi:hypothetical protein
MVTAARGKPAGVPTPAAARELQMRAMKRISHAEQGFQPHRSAYVRKLALPCLPHQREHAVPKTQGHADDRDADCDDVAEERIDARCEDLLVVAENE